jgi:glycosyltransferase involved in cell wall biosynthesis
MKPAIVISLYNEKAHIPTLLKALENKDLDVIVVDDGSGDGSGELSRKFNITLLTHPVNLGKGAAMKTGAIYAFNNGYEYVIFMDADGQHDPGDLKFFTEKMTLKKYDLILGSRGLGKDAPFIRALGNKIASIVIKLFFNIKVSDPLSGFRALSNKGFETVNWQSTGYSVESEILAKAGTKKLSFVEVPVATIYHNKDKGVTMMDAFSVLLDVIKWRLT